MERTRSEWRETTLAEAGERKPQRQGSQALSTPRRAAAAQWPMEVSQLGVETGSVEAALGAEAGKAGRCWSCHRSCSRRAASLALGLAAAAADGMEKELHAGGITCIGIGIGIGTGTGIGTGLTCHMCMDMCMDMCMCMCMCMSHVMSTSMSCRA